MLWSEPPDDSLLDRDRPAGPAVAHKLDPNKAIIDARLEAVPRLSAKRLFDEIRAAGYPGSYSRVSDYGRTSWPSAPVQPPLVRCRT